MKRTTIITTLLFGLIFPYSGHVHSTKNTSHEAFLSLEKQAKKSNKKKFYKALENSDHPLKPYAESIYLARNPRLANTSEINRFLSTYEGTPLEWKVRTKWLEYLQKKNRKEQYINAFRATKNAALTCTYLTYKLQLGAPKKAIYSQVEELWNVANSQPKECDVLFAHWRKAGNLDQALLWQRITKVSEKGDTSLLRYLSKLMPENERYLAELYRKVRQSPSASAGLYRYKNRSEKEAQIALYGLRRLIWRNNDLALKAWPKIDKMFIYSEAQKQALYYDFALALAVDKHPEARFYLNKVSAEKHDKKLMQWQLSTFISGQDWHGIIAYSVGKELNNSYQYWLAYAYDKTNDKKKAQAIWSELSTKRDYYGFLSASRLNRAVALENKAPNVNQDIQKLVAGHPAFKRATALYELKRYYSARREWNHLIASSTKQEQLAAASLASNMGWHDRVIRVMSQLGEYNILDYRFPTPHSKQFARFSRRNRIDEDWAYAISRRESSFATDAYSSVGAIGLMQLLPTTARYVNKGNVSRNQLKNPSINIRLGTQYLDYLKKKSKGNEVVATASYNAGYSNVKSWLPKEAVDFDIWVEGIPYRETREYVKNVYAYRQVYSSRRGNEENLFDELLEMKIKL